MNFRRCAACALWLWSVSAPADAQVLPSEPITFGDGRVTLGGDISATYGSEDPGFFNYTDYDYSTLRMLRIDIAATISAGDHVAILGEVRTENFSNLLPYALYLRYRPWMDKDVSIAVGRVPPTFGAYPRRSYGADNPLIGYPLGYQYLTTLRPDSLPANADELLRKRGLGWLDRFSIGDQALDQGVPLASAFRWDTGVQFHAGTFTQSAWGTDVEYSAGYLLVRFESIATRWRLPVIDPVAADLPVSSVSTSVEGRYKILPGLYAAARVDRLVFSELAGTTQTLPWDANVGRVEVGAGFSLQRNVLLKTSFQHNSRDGGPLSQMENLGAVQLVYWF